MAAMDLFDSKQGSKEPLAARMRPRTLDEYIGQDHIVGKGRLLRRAIAADQLTSVIFYGPPGTGKTTLARVIANHTKSNFITLNAVLTGVQNIRDSIAQAEQHYKLYGRRTILFVDEVHRWNRSQQDALLPWVENGTIILVGATTENPFFEVNKALVSRSRVFQLKPLEKKDLEKAVHMAISDKERGYGRWNVLFEEGALDHLIETANGDARSLLNALELAVETTPEKWQPEETPAQPAPGTDIYISRETAEESIQCKVVLYDRDGDYHYDIISAFIKSLRGRDPDAAMYWLARMVAAGEDPGFIFRRMLISACEDTGLADPNAVGIVESCAAAFDRVGLPEGRYHLAHAALYLATAPKSNSSMAFFDALAAVEKEDSEVPNHLRDASRDAEGFGHGAGYMYPHAYKDHWVAQQYLPSALTGRVFYTPSDQGYEQLIRTDVLARRELQITTILEEQTKKQNAGLDLHEINPLAEWWQKEHFKVNPIKSAESLTFSPSNPKTVKTLERAEASWQKRLDSNKAELLSAIRNTLMRLADPSRHSRNFIWNADDGLLIWECTRKSPEGFTAGVCRNQQNKQILEQYAHTLGELERPVITVLAEAPETQEAQRHGAIPGAFSIPLKEFAHIEFDILYFRDPFSTVRSIETFAQSLRNEEGKLAPDWKCVITQKIPNSGQRLGKLVQEQILKQRTAQYAVLLQKMADAEESFFTDTTNPLFAWSAESAAVLIAGTQTDCRFNTAYTVQSFTEKRRITVQEISKWFNTESSAYGMHLAQRLSDSELSEIKQLIETASSHTVFDWETQNAFFTISCRGNDI